MSNGKSLTFVRRLWPDVTTRQGTTEATRAGALAIAYLAIAYILYSLRIGAALAIADEETLRLVQDQYETNLVLSLAAYAAGILPAAALAYFVWARHSLVAMWIGAAWLAVEVGSKLLFGGSERMIVAGIIAVLCSVQGLRGVHAVKSGIVGTEAPAEL
jgi:hypothetical protein